MAPGLVMTAKDVIGTKEQTASLYAALLDAGSEASGPRYESRTVASFAGRRTCAVADRAIARSGVDIVLARLSPYSV